MMIKEQVKALWKICFDDSEEFVEMYFRLRYKTEVNVAIQSGDEVISALQMLPYPMTFGGETVQTSYISGACTHPDFRSKGVMRELLSQSFARMLQNISRWLKKHGNISQQLLCSLMARLVMCNRLVRKRYPVRW